MPDSAIARFPDLSFQWKKLAPESTFGSRTQVYLVAQTIPLSQVSRLVLLIKFSDPDYEFDYDGIEIESSAKVISGNYIVAALSIA